MADIFNEVDEELRRERLRQIWERYRVLIIAAAVLIVGGVGGWRGYEWYQFKRASESGAQFESAVTLASEGKYQEAEAAFGKIAQEGTAYKTLARLRQASELARQDRDGALKIYDSIVADASSGPVFQDLARVRGGQIAIDTASLDDMKKRLSGATDAGRVFRHSARELLAFSAWRANDGAAVKQWVDAIIADPDTPNGIRSRSEMLMSLSAPEARS
ncbi:hypothetical protein GJW-30_1_03104 [Variibacter gotjawalensis]|uniref:Ancillary SecYEG translocon subunit/Cell division coordinator CpoB TPR domain-containing protein n=1 Tax=Variibacter gotjawalensis TaxID=1333996 RepID=A0A0S3PXC2_9BRAD|nr:tetratricopeptide repeat protein [Variibacter gotjawalensis]NIK46388.1 hypothetical protein [Variibacter gotjawalensis]RZS48298.1 hypothetical protein EV661_0706 [Variibacter gotjawalensis]BAT60558.1 hypothetical protein GJW-30_1_03104 [Variibacter gotjawalensis]